MHMTNVIVWKSGDAWLAYLEQYPDYWTQGETLGDLEKHLKDLATTIPEILGERRGSLPPSGPPA
jgi:predicted RNase H-like HicB family nuclease